MMNSDLAALSRANDVVNAISNTCKTLVKAHDGNIFLLNQEGGLQERIINHDTVECGLELEKCKSGDDLPIYAFSEKFKDDMLNTVYKSVIPNYYEQVNDDCGNLKMALGCIPGLVTIKNRVCALLGEYNLSNQVSSSDLDNFFIKHKCDNPLCASKDFFYMIKPGSEPPMLNVSHPDWLYNTPHTKDEDHEYVHKFIQYIKLFLSEPVSKKCVLCDIFFTLTESENSVNLFGLPEEFIMNETICKWVYEENGKSEDLQLKDFMIVGLSKDKNLT